VLVLCAPISWAHAQDASFTVGFPQYNMADDWRRAQVMAVAGELNKHDDIEFIYTDARGDTAKNIRNIEKMVHNGIDLLIISPRNIAAITPVITQVRLAGIPVVLLTQRILTDDYTTFVSADDDKIAQRAATYMAQQMNERGKILILQGVPSTATAIKRTEGFLSEMAKYQNIDVVALKTANNLRLEAAKMVEMALEEGLEFDAIYAQSDSMASGARLALKEAGIDPKSKLIVSIDYIPETRAAIRAGEQNATFTYPTSGREGAQLAVRILKGEMVAREVEVPSEMVTRINVDHIDTVF